MTLLDSDIVLCWVQPHHQLLRDFIFQNSPSVSAVTYVEVLGFHDLTPTDQTYLQEFFAASDVLQLTQNILGEAVRRQTRRMSWGDYLIAATCWVRGLTLVTRNVGDFSWSAELQLINPFDLSGANAVQG